MSKLLRRLKKENLYIKLHTLYYNFKSFTINLPFFLKMAWKFRPWDYNYNITLFVKSLEVTAKNIKENDIFIGSQRVYRRAMTAAGLLDRAYNRDISKSQSYFLKVIYREDGLLKKSDKYLKRKEFYDKLYEISNKRAKEVEEQAKKEAWEYINKYIEHFWD